MKKAKSDSSWRSNPLQVQPLGNALFAPKTSLNSRTQGLGGLSRIPDELLLTVFAHLSAEDFIAIQGTSRHIYAWCHIEGLWKTETLLYCKGKMPFWCGSWYATYMQMSRGRTPSFLQTPNVFSDVLYQPSLCAQVTIDHVPRQNILVLDQPSELPAEPCIIRGVMDNWPAINDPKRRWTLNNLTERWRTVEFVAEAAHLTLETFSQYHGDCAMDDTPLYIFDSQFAEKTDALEDYSVPSYFASDLFSLLGDERPDFRWLIIGSPRSGSSWHQDPNGTSAWNAVTEGEKLWLALPPHVTPCGVRVSDDNATVEAPLSLAEWIESYLGETLARFGPRSRNPVLKVGLHRAGELFYIPAGWWHMVVNLSTSVAVTQNYVAPDNLEHVLRFMRDRPEQLSGFVKDAAFDQDPDGSVDMVRGIVAKFREALEQKGFEAVRRVPEDPPSQKVSLWEHLKPEDESSFSFNFV